VPQVCTTNTVAQNFLNEFEALVWSGRTAISGSQSTPAKETVMAGIGKFRLSDAISQLLRIVGRKHGGRPKSSHELTAEQTREAKEAEEARNAEASIQDRMVDIGRGNQQAGRQGQ